MSQIQGYRPGGGGTGFLQTLTGNTGGAVPPTGNNIDVVGAGGVTVTGNPGTSTLTITATDTMGWTVVTLSQTMAVNSGYITNSGGTIVLTLPTVSSVGDRVRVAGLAGAWQIAQGAGQKIHCIGSDTTLGVGGSLSSTTAHDTIELVCAVDNLTWIDISMNGNITVV